jgi:hypothetical protein
MEDHENFRDTREQAIGAAVLRYAFGTGDVTVHTPPCHGTPDCTCTPVTIHVNHDPSECEDEA